MKVSIDKEKCIGCAACVAVNPDVFEMMGDKAIVKVAKTTDASVKDAETACPSQAIKVGK